MHIILDVLAHSLMISGFVLLMMILVEYITIQTKGQWSHVFEQKAWLRILLATLLGLSPGCLGGYTVVTLYSHKVMGFPALVASMIATSGDEAFFMFSMIPAQALEIHLYLFLIAFVVGMAMSLYAKRWTLMRLDENHLQYHAAEPQCYCFDKRALVPQLRQITFTRALLLFIGVAFLLFIGYNNLHSHEGHHNEAGDWQGVLFFALTLVYLFITATVPEHFLKEHMWEHTIKRHLPKIFAWTFGAFLLIHFLDDVFSVKAWIADNPWWILLLAVLVGLIPESGPHMVFITLFAQGAVPMSVVLASSIVQDGHAALPLLAESPRSFLWMKLVNLLVGVLVGAGMMAFGM